MIRSVKSQARFPLNWTPYFTLCLRLSVIQLETRSEKLSPSILTRGSSQSEEGRGRIEKNLFSARELSPHLRNCDKFTSAQKEPIRAAQCKAEGSTRRETANAKEAHRCECGFKSPLATHTVGLRKIQNANKHKTKKKALKNYDY